MADSPSVLSFWSFSTSHSLLGLITHVPKPEERKDCLKLKANLQGEAGAGRASAGPGPASPGASPGSGAVCHVGPAQARPGLRACGRLSSRRGSRISAVVQRHRASAESLGSAFLPGPAPPLRQPSHGLDRGGGGGGGEPRGPRRALGAHAPVRHAARAAGRVLRCAGQLRRRARLARPR